MKYDVIVVGAGPAGSTAAKYLAEQGVHTLLVDKDTFPRVKPCGGGLPVRVFQSFPYLKSEKLINSYSYGGCLHSSQQTNTLEFQEEIPLIAMFQRKRFDHGLIQCAQAEGAVFLQNRHVLDVSIQKDDVKVCFENHDPVESSVVIGADGVWSIIAKKTGFPIQRRRYGLSMVQETPCSSSLLDQFFTPQRTAHAFLLTQMIRGYGWVFPKKDHLNIGICEFETPWERKHRSLSLKEAYLNFFHMLQTRKVIPSAIKSEGVKGAGFPLQPLNRTYGNRVLLCGDAAGLINPVTGEGIFHAMLSGRIAAEVITDALHKKDFSAHFLKQYEIAWKKEFARLFGFMLRIQKQWGKNTDRFVRFAEGDPVIAQLIGNIATGDIRLDECKVQVFLRLFFLFIRKRLE